MVLVWKPITILTNTWVFNKTLFCTYTMTVEKFGQEYAARWLAYVDRLVATLRWERSQLAVRQLVREKSVAAVFPVAKTAVENVMATLVRRATVSISGQPLWENPVWDSLCDEYLAAYVAVRKASAMLSMAITILLHEESVMLLSASSASVTRMDRSTHDYFVKTREFVQIHTGQLLAQFESLFVTGSFVDMPVASVPQVPNAS